MFRQHMVNGDFRVSKNMKVLKAKEGRDRKESRASYFIISATDESYWALNS